MTATLGFGDRVDAAMSEKGSCLVVGLDPVLEKLPREVFGAVGEVNSGTRGLTAKASIAFGLFLTEVIDAVADVAVAVKPNTAYFERFGASGMDCLLQVCRTAQKAGLLVIADAKRGDIAHTAQAYADALLGDLPDTVGPYVDAVTLHPYLGTDSIAPYLEYAGQGKGVFVLVRTSNPSGAEFQDLVCGDEPLYVRVARQVAEWGQGRAGPCGLGPVGAVVGATQVESAVRVRQALPESVFLVPGVGAQGARPEDLAPYFLPGGRGAIVNASRSILYAEPAASGGSWKDAVRAAAMATRDALEGVRREA